MGATFRLLIAEQGFDALAGLVAGFGDEAAFDAEHGNLVLQLEHIGQLQIFGGRQLGMMRPSRPSTVCLKVLTLSSRVWPMVLVKPSLMMVSFCCSYKSCRDFSSIWPGSSIPARESIRSVTLLCCPPIAPIMASKELILLWVVSCELFLWFLVPTTPLPRSIFVEVVHLLSFRRWSWGQKRLGRMRKRF
jgi:hypothetical protein